MFKSTIPIQVRYAETDQMGVVYHANYLVWFELGRTAFFDELGYSYQAFEESGLVAPVVDIQASFKRPVKYGDDVLVTTWVQSYDGLRITYAYEIATAANGVCVTGWSKHVCVRKETFRPVSMRKLHPVLHQAYADAAQQ